MRISDWSSDVCSSDLDAAPALRPRIRAATWIGNRRWNLLFDSGETLALPEEDAARALVKFAELDGADRLLGKGFLRFDMRDPTKLVERKNGVEGKSGAVRVDLGGRGLLQKKIKTTNTTRSEDIN